MRVLLWDGDDADGDDGDDGELASFASCNLCRTAGTNSSHRADREDILFPMKVPSEEVGSGEQQSRSPHMTATFVLPYPPPSILLLVRVRRCASGVGRCHCGRRRNHPVVQHHGRCFAHGQPASIERVH